jgi:serine/threonine-protein kinase ULK4
VERLTKEKDQYVQQCMEALVQTVVSVIPSILESISTDIAQLAGGRRPAIGPASSPLSTRGTTRSSIPLFPVVLNLMNSPTFRNRMVDEPVLSRLASFLKRLETSSFQVSVLGIFMSLDSEFLYRYRTRLSILFLFMSLHMGHP